MYGPLKGTGHATKSDEFSEKFQTAFDPPHPHPHFWKIMLQFFIMDMVEHMQGGMMARYYEMHAHDFQK